MQRHNTTYYFINLAIASVLSIAIAVILSFAASSYESLFIQSYISQVHNEACVNDIDNNIPSESYSLNEQPLAAPLYLSNNNVVPAVQSLTKLSKSSTSARSLIAQKDIQTHHILSDYHLSDIFLLSHRPAMYYIFALNRMRD